MYVGDVAEQAVYRLLHVRVEVHRVKHFDVAVIGGNTRQRFADAFEAVAEVFAAVAGDQDQAFVVVEEIELVGELTLQGTILADFVFHVEQCIDHGVAGDVDALGADVFTQEIVARGIGGREVPVGQCAGKAAVGFFRPRRIKVAGAQAGFDVTDGNALVIGGE